MFSIGILYKYLLHEEKECYCVNHSEKYNIRVCAASNCNYIQY